MKDAGQSAKLKSCGSAPHVITQVTARTTTTTWLWLQARREAVASISKLTDARLTHCCAAHGRAGSGCLDSFDCICAETQHPRATARLVMRASMWQHCQSPVEALCILSQAVEVVELGWMSEQVSSLKKGP